MSSSSSSLTPASSSVYGPITLEELGQSHPLQAQRYRLLSGLGAYFGEIPHTSAALAKIVANYVQEAVVFGPRDYRTHYGVDVGDDTLSEEDLQWWNSLDGITPFDAQGNPIYNYETHYGFYYIPATCKPLTERAARILGVHVGEEVPMDIENHDLLAAEPEVGHPSRFQNDSESLHQNKKIQAAASYWIAPRKNVLFRNETAVRQRALMQGLNIEIDARMQTLGARFGTLMGTRYENLPDLRDLSLIARNHLAKTGGRILGDPTGLEGRWTFSRTEQWITLEDRNAEGVVVARRTYPVDVGGQAPLVAGDVGGSRPSGGLYVYSSGGFGDGDFGVAGLRKSSGHRPLVH